MACLSQQAGRCAVEYFCRIPGESCHTPGESVNDLFVSLGRPSRPATERRLSADGRRGHARIPDCTRGGKAKTAATLSGRRAFQELAAQTGTYEAGLALGLPAPEAIRLVIQPTAGEALMPGIDQTRTVGLVTLPGAFIGVLLGGGTPVDAGAAQVLVLLGLLAAQSLTSAALLGLITRGSLARRDLLSIPR